MTTASTQYLTSLVNDTVLGDRSIICWMFKVLKATICRNPASVISIVGPGMLARRFVRTRRQQIGAPEGAKTRAFGPTLRLSPLVGASVGNSDVCSTVSLLATCRNSSSLPYDRDNIVETKEEDLMTDIYPTVIQCAAVATAFKLLLFPA